MRFEKIHFANPQGEKISARLDLPTEGPPVAYTLFAHCFTCSKNLVAVRHISQALTARGFAVLRFDFTGLGESEGEFSETNFSSNVADLIAAANFLEEHYEAPRILVGHSLGGAAVLQAAGRLPGTVAVATIGAPYDPGHVEHLFESSKAEIEATGEAVVNLGGRPFTIKKQFLDDLDAQTVEETIKNLDRALLIFHSPVDQIVGVENAASIYKSAKHPKSFVSLDQADHLLTNPEDSEYVGTVLAAWAQKYIGPINKRDAEHDKSHHHEGYVVTRIEKSHYRTDIYAGGHTLVADEPKSVGGTDLGPTPYDLLNAGLGACTVITLRMYADRKGWPLTAVTARIKHEKVHAKDCETCDKKDITGKIDRITREIMLEGPLDAAQRSRLIEISNRCPVHRTLHGHIHVDTVEVDSVDVESLEIGE